ncbi:eukaryotic translation initiation factor 5-like [Senna tora]|uniref:Eukaryotic translation initiation factor 5-like n=1 Tax=Senna tora TaxID=362788 RepID=A0A834WIN9_9FABA|nr:eukaryotic translation initiation factor 5-like [Senna tora]
MALQNIGAQNSDDAFYRYKMPKMITKIEGRGNGIKTNIVNMVDIAKALARPASYTTKYFGCELGAQSKFDEKSGTSHVNGAHDTSKLAGLLENFIKKYVQCYGCGNPETEILITKNQMIQLKCAACGFVSDVDMRDKLTTFIIKNPPEPKKGSKDKKAMRRAEKERLKEGEAADEEQKKLKKDVKKKGSSSSKDGTTKTNSSKKKSGGSDEDRASPTHNQISNEAHEEEDDDDADDVQWQTDTSLEAARQRIQEQLNTVTADMVMLATDEPEKKAKAANKMNALVEALFDSVEKGFAKEAAKKKSYLAAASSSNALKEVALVLKALYDNQNQRKNNVFVQVACFAIMLKQLTEVLYLLLKGLMEECIDRRVVHILFCQYMALFQTLLALNLVLISGTKFSLHDVFDTLIVDDKCIVKGSSKFQEENFKRKKKKGKKFIASLQSYREESVEKL